MLYYYVAVLNEMYKMYNHRISKYNRKILIDKLLSILQVLKYAA